MSHKITPEEEKKIASWYDRLSQDQIRKRSGHGWTQVNRALKAKNIAWLLYHEMQDHSLTKYANKHLQEKLERLEHTVKFETVNPFLLMLLIGLCLVI